ncbi:bleomycin resistance protein [Deinococcus sp.]|uniref:bleomycin resistance protein n=1 Tax=Deinococcus sp. TaxID=47478 RepID=UPI003C7AB772
MHWAALVPELVVSDLNRSLETYALFGFSVAYRREDFAYLASGGAQMMLQQGPVAEAWSTLPLDYPFGRGINFQIEVADLEAAGYPLRREARSEWYRADDIEHGQRECLLLDPDGYLLRFCQPLGERPAGE